MLVPTSTATFPIRERAHHDHPGVTRPLPVGAPRVSVVIPARNEAMNLPIVLSELPIGLHEVILVDGASRDGTIRAARRARPDIRVLRQTGTGKGNALACGILAATGDIVITLDADGSADPAEITDFVAALVEGADYAKGSRFLPGGGSSDLTVLRRAGNAALVFLMNRVYRTGFSDLCYGYNAFWTRCSDALDLQRIAEPEPVFGDGFEIETMLAAHAATAHLTVAEVASYERDSRCAPGATDAGYCAPSCANACAPAANSPAGSTRSSPPRTPARTDRVHRNPTEENAPSWPAAGQGGRPRRRGVLPARVGAHHSPDPEPETEPPKRYPTPRTVVTHRLSRPVSPSLCRRFAICTSIT
jgi:hypothetical protein